MKEFDKVDEAFQNCGWSDMRLGLVGLERLKKTANIQQVAAQIPSLPKLVPFLEITPHQEYLITRIKGNILNLCYMNFFHNLNLKKYTEERDCENYINIFILHISLKYT